MNLPALTFNPTGWLAGEKLDGVHGIADSGILRTRHGRRLPCPAWFIAGLPAGRLHGEIWAGNGRFADVAAGIQRKGGNWRGLRFMLFDAAGDGPLDERLATLAALPLPGHVQCIPHRVITSRADADEWEERVFRAAGEGLVLRRPCSEYRPGHGILKIKRLHGDVNRWHG